VHSTRSDKVYQLLAHGRWFSPGTPASSTTKAGRHDIAEILLKVLSATSIFKRYMYIIDHHKYMSTFISIIYVFSHVFLYIMQDVYLHIIDFIDSEIGRIIYSHFQTMT
jgi:hypothetical protein